jgi:hypothetical protein
MLQIVKYYSLGGWSDVASQWAYEGIVLSDQGLFSAGSPVTKVLESIAVAGATATYGNLNVKTKMKNYLFTTPVNKISHQVQGDLDRKTFRVK